MNVNLRGGWALVKATWASWLQYRSFFFILAFSWMIAPLISLFIWTAAAGTNGTIQGMDRGAFVGYYLAVIVVNQLTYAQTNWTLGDVIRSGGMNSWLLRPVAPLFNVLSSEVAGKVVYMIFTGPVVLLLALLLKPEMNISAPNAALFVVSVVLAWGLRTFWGMWLALLAFWATRADALLAVQDSLVFLLAGMIAPVSLLPDGMQVFARVLPFRYMIGFPVEVLMGTLSAGELAFGFALQSGWLALALGLSWMIWRQGVRRYAAIGG